MLILGTVVAVAMVVRKRKKGGTHFESRGGGGGMGGGSHPVRYKPANSQAQLLSQDKEIVQIEPIEYEDMMDDEYVEVEQQQQKEFYEYVETNRNDTIDYKENLEDYLSASGKLEKQSHGEARGQGDGREMKKGGAGLKAPKSPQTKPKARKDDKGYVNDMDAFAKELKKADLESMNTITTDDNGRDTPPYVNDFSEFSKQLHEQADLSSTKTTPPTSASKKTKPQYVNDFDTFSKQLQEARSTEREEESKSEAGKGKKRSKRGYVNELGEIDGFPSDEDEEGYTIFDPKRTQPDGAEVIEDDIYEDNPVERVPDIMGRGSNNKRLDSNKNQNEVQGGAVPQRKTSEQRPYVNDLQSITTEAKILLAKEEAMRRHHPYVNDVARMVYEASLKEKQEQQLGEGGSEVKGHSEKREASGGEKDKHNYVNDLASLLLKNS